MVGTCWPVHCQALIVCLSSQEPRPVEGGWESTPLNHGMKTDDKMPELQENEQPHCGDPRMTSIAAGGDAVPGGIQQRTSSLQSREGDALFWIFALNF